MSVAKIITFLGFIIFCFEFSILLLAKINEGLVYV